MIKIPEQQAQIFQKCLWCGALCVLQGYMQPHLLGNEFTHLEFPRRVQRKEVGKRMLYRDFTMNGWYVRIFSIFRKAQKLWKCQIICSVGKLRKKSYHLTIKLLFIRFTIFNSNWLFKKNNEKGQVLTHFYETHFLPIEKKLILFWKFPNLTPLMTFLCPLWKKNQLSVQQSSWSGFLAVILSGTSAELDKHTNKLVVVQPL